MNDILLKGVVGSTAYGLAHEGSDIDYLGVFAAPTKALLGLHPPKDSQVTKDPDTTLHEARKFVGLCLGGNPTAFELLWLEEYEVQTRLGGELIDIRESFLGAHRVRDAYLGYAWQQFERIADWKHIRERALREGREEEWEGRNSARREKHARHLVRLVQQGLELYTTGKLTLRLDNPEYVRDMGRRIAETPSIGQDFMTQATAGFDPARSVLPEKADETEAAQWLELVRTVYWSV